MLKFACLFAVAATAAAALLPALEIPDANIVRKNVQKFFKDPLALKTVGASLSLLIEDTKFKAACTAKVDSFQDLVGAQGVCPEVTDPQNLGNGLGSGMLNLFCNSYKCVNDVNTAYELTTDTCLKLPVVSFGSSVAVYEDNLVDYAFDGDVDTYYEATSGAVVVEACLDSPTEIQKIRFHPRRSMEIDTNLLRGGVFKCKTKRGRNGWVKISEELWRISDGWNTIEFEPITCSCISFTFATEQRASVAEIEIIAAGIGLDLGDGTPVSKGSDNFCTCSDGTEKEYEECPFNGAPYCLCEADYHVKRKVCVKCPVGKIRPKGDNPTGKNTPCIACGEDLDDPCTPDVTKIQVNKIELRKFACAKTTDYKYCLVGLGESLDLFSKLLKLLDKKNPSKKDIKKRIKESLKALDSVCSDECQNSMSALLPNNLSGLCTKDETTKKKDDYCISTLMSKFSDLDNDSSSEDIGEFFCSTCFEALVTPLLAALPNGKDMKKIKKQIELYTSAEACARPNDGATCLERTISAMNLGEGTPAYTGSKKVCTCIDGTKKIDVDCPMNGANHCLCEADYHVKDKVCVKCPVGKVNPQGDDPNPQGAGQTKGNTRCTKIEKQRTNDLCGFAQTLQSCCAGFMADYVKSLETKSDKPFKLSSCDDVDKEKCPKSVAALRIADGGQPQQSAGPKAKVDEGMSKEGIAAIIIGVAVFSLALGGTYYILVSKPKRVVEVVKTASEPPMTKNPALDSDDEIEEHEQTEDGVAAGCQV